MIFNTRFLRVLDGDVDLESAPAPDVSAAQGI